MKHSQYRILALVIALLAPTGRCCGDALTVTGSPVTQMAIRGDVVTFQGTIRNGSATPIFLSGDSITLSLHGHPILPVTFDLYADDAPFTKGAPVQLAPGAEWSGSLFKVTIGVDASETTYDASFAVLGGTDPAALDSVGNGVFHLTVTGVPATSGPAAPADLSAAVAGSDARLAWVDQAVNEDGFSIEQSVDGINYTMVALVGADRRSYVVRPLGPSDLYFFRVRAFNGFGGLAYSDYSSVAVTQTVHPAHIVVPWNAQWDYMNPMGGAAPGALPLRPNGTVDTDFLTTWHLSESEFAAQYDGPIFGASPARTGVLGNAATYDSGTSPGPLGYGPIAYFTTGGAEFSSFGKTLTTPLNNQRWTSYFRHAFTVSDAGIAKPVIRYLIDDGGYMYLDGILVATVGIEPDSADPGRPVADTFTGLAADGNEVSLRTLDLSDAPGPVSGTNARIWVSVPGLAAGRHTLAVSVHQAAANSSDLIMSLELSGQPAQRVFTYAQDAAAQVATSDGGAFVIARTGATGTALTVNLEIGSGPGQALPGSRYMLVPGGPTVTIPAGQAGTTIMVNPLADTPVRGTETVTMNLAEGTGYEVGLPSAATVQLLDSPINLWKIAQFGGLAAAQGPAAADDAAPAGDSVANLLKYSLGLAPFTPAVGLLESGLEEFGAGSHLTLTVTRPHPVPADITYHFECSGDPADVIWNPAEIVPGYPIIDAGETTQTMKVRDPEPSAGKPRGFIRLRVTRP